MRQAMPPHLAALPAGLLQHLGQLSPPEVLAQDLFEALHPFTPLPAANAQDLAQQWRQHPAIELVLRLHGIDLKLQSLAVPDASTWWGLHSISLHARHHKQKVWAGPWPQGLDPDTTRPEQLVALLAKDTAHALCVSGLVSFGVDGIDGQHWALSAVFDAANQLQNLHLMRLGDWRTGAALPEANHG